MCQKHYRRFTAKRDSLATDEERSAFEAMCIERGWVEPKQTGGRPREADPFDALIAEVQAEFAADIAAAVARDEKQQAIEDAKKAAKGKSSGQGRRKAN